MSEEKPLKKKSLKLLNVRNQWMQLSSGWRGAVIGLALIALILYMVQAYHMLGTRGPLDYIIGSVVFLLAILLITAVLALVIHGLKKIPALYMWIALASFILVFICFIGPVQLMFVVTFSIMLAFSIAGMLVWRIVKGHYRQAGRLSKIMMAGLSILSLAYVILGSLWLFQNGNNDLPTLYELKALKDSEQYSHSWTDPSAPGPYEVKTLTYGAANSYRKEFNAEHSFVTEPVDGSTFVENWSSIRTKTFGFGPDKMPLNGTVWFPDDEGSFPLVIAVHGNHLATDYSDLGYDYLGHLLASKGYIFVSIDENFLNTSPYDDIFMLKVLENENPARGWLILEHLKVWEQWNDTAEHPFFNKVDMNHISLIGHSRGGEAVAVAALYNQLPSSPEDGNIKFDYHFNIRSIISIAGTDSQYKPAGQFTPLKDISYLAIQGSHDMDVSSFDTVNQYDRIDFTENSNQFKSTVYVYGANHGQFNTTWGKYDGIGFGNRLYNTVKLLPEEEQLQVAKVLIASFLEATLKQKTEYQSIFQDLGYAKEWLPNTMYINDYWDGKTVMIANFTEDLDFSTTTVEGGKLEGNALEEWKEEKVKAKYADSSIRAVRLDWNREAATELPSYTVILSGTDIIDEIAANKRSSIVFSIANRDKGKLGEENQLLDLSILAEDSDGHTASLPLSDAGALLPMIEGDIIKWPFTSLLPTKEPIFQNFSISFSAFQKVNPHFQPDQLTKISFLFNETNKGSIYLTNIGLR